MCISMLSCRSFVTWLLVLPLTMASDEARTCAPEEEYEQSEGKRRLEPPLLDGCDYLEYPLTPKISLEEVTSLTQALRDASLLPATVDMTHVVEFSPEAGNALTEYLSKDLSRQPLPPQVLVRPSWSSRLFKSVATLPLGTLLPAARAQLGRAEAHLAQLGRRVAAGGQLRGRQLAADGVDGARERFLANGWRRAVALDMNETYARLDPVERARVERIERFDEFEEWTLIMSHYCVSYGVNDDVSDGFLVDFNL